MYRENSRHANSETNTNVLGKGDELKKQRRRDWNDTRANFYIDVKGISMDRSRRDKMSRKL